MAEVKNAGTTALQAAAAAENRRRVFPLGKEIMNELLQSVSTAAFVAICSGFVLLLQGITDEETTNLFRTMFYIYLPVGLLGLVTTAVARKVDEFVDAAAGFLLANFCVIHVVGCIYAVRELKTGAWPAIAVAVILVVATVVGWSYCFSYPKFLRYGIADADTNGTDVQSDDATNVKKCVTCSADTVGGKAVQLATEGEKQCKCGAADKVD